MLAPDSWSAYQRNAFSEPTLLDLPTERKTLNFLTWDIWFPFINANFLTFQLPGLGEINSYIFRLYSSSLGQCFNV